MKRTRLAAAIGTAAIAAAGLGAGAAIAACGSARQAPAAAAAPMVDPTIVVKAHAHVSMRVVNADPDTAHGLVITAGGARSSWMPMLTAGLAFPGSAAWFLGNPTSAGMHAATLSFTAGTLGTYVTYAPSPGTRRRA